MTRLGYEAGGNEDNYVEKCMKCKHSYTKKNESDTLFCRLSRHVMHCRNISVTGGTDSFSDRQGIFWMTMYQ